MGLASSKRHRCLLLVLFPLLLAGCAGLDLQKRSTPYYDPSAAREQYRTMLQDQAERPESRRQKPEPSARKLLEGDQHFRQGDLRRAVVAYFQAARLDPDALEPRLRFAHLEMQANPERAERSFEELAENEPDEAAVWFGLGLARLAQSELEGSLDALACAVALDPDSAAVRSAFGVVHDRLGQHTQAQAHLKRALELQPDDITILNNLAVSYLVTGELAEAEQLLRRASKLDPDDRATHNNLGLTLGLQERYEEAFRIFRRLDDEQAAQNNLAYVYYLNGRPGEASAIYEQALLTGGDHAVTILKNLRKARQALERGSQSALH
jgi:Flp pilus assembly protein TadD